MNIEKVANSEFEYIAGHNKYLISLQELQAFAEAYARATLQTKPVAEGINEDFKYDAFKHWWNGLNDVVKEQFNQSDSMSAFYAGMHFNTLPPSTVPVEKYNKMLQWVCQLGHEVERRGITLTIEGKDFRQAIAEAEGKP